MRLVSSVDDSFATHTFPTTTAEFVEEHGHKELELPNGAATLEEVLSCLPNEDFETEEDARLAVYSALGEEAIGRKGYSDRDATAPGENGHDVVSL
ncbi:DUF5789 family protein [Salinibaculum rarum]|uniref:DUF5789 family protein n=1 Tax=Salinibaculum rarum TaxID=3058903 RepID=UPI00265D9832|nr:DUF2795 domain-containing protein [Salinibaculum sp. KK48]